MHASTFWGLDGRPIVLSIPSIPLFLSLGRVVPAPHTRHLLGLFAAIAQNSLLRSFSIVDSLASRQHSCRGSEELAIRKTARFQAGALICDANPHHFLRQFFPSLQALSRSYNLGCEIPHPFEENPFRACSSKTLLGVLGVARIGSE